MYDVGKRLWVIFSSGRQHLANIELCSCQDDALFFVQQRLWPASPRKPQFCFQFEFLDRIESLLLENQTSLKGFCDGIKEALPKLIKDNVCISFLSNVANILMMLKLVFGFLFMFKLVFLCEIDSDECSYPFFTCREKIFIEL